MKNRDEVQKIIVDGVTYDNVSEIVEMMNNSFQKVFTEESEFEGIALALGAEGRRRLESIQTSAPEIRKLLEELDARKAVGP